MTAPELVDAARAEGYRAAGASPTREQNPHRSGDEEPTSQSAPLSVAWLEGYDAGVAAIAAGTYEP